jgi:hypothetical protein
MIAPINDDFLYFANNPKYHHKTDKKQGIW